MNNNTIINSTELPLFPLLINNYSNITDNSTINNTELNLFPLLLDIKVLLLIILLLIVKNSFYCLILRMVMALSLA